MIDQKINQVEKKQNGINESTINSENQKEISKVYENIEIILDKAFNFHNQNISNYISQKINDALAQFQIDNKLAKEIEKVPKLTEKDIAEKFVLKSTFEEYIKNIKENQQKNETKNSFPLDKQISNICISIGKSSEELALMKEVTTILSKEVENIKRETKRDILNLDLKLAEIEASIINMKETFQVLKQKTELNENASNKQIQYMNENLKNFPDEIRKVSIKINSVEQQGHKHESKIKEIEEALKKIDKNISNNILNNETNVNKLNELNLANNEMKIQLNEIILHMNQIQVNGEKVHIL